MTRNGPLPLLLLTGFLGSGKTTTLGHWLSHTDVPLKRTAVIINDFGAVNVDAALLARRQLELRSITGGCVCCQSFEDLVAQVAALADNPDFDLVWIETSGLADPEEVLDHLSAPELQDRTVIRRMILVIDGSDFPCSWRGRAVQEEQVRYADLIVLNKTDRLDDAARQRVEISLRQINPSARIVTTRHGEVAPGLLSEIKARRPAVWHGAHRPLADEDHEHEHDHDHDEAIASCRLDSFSAAVRAGGADRFPTLFGIAAGFGFPCEGLYPPSRISRATPHLSAGPRPVRTAPVATGKRRGYYNRDRLHRAESG